MRFCKFFIVFCLCVQQLCAQQKTDLSGSYTVKTSSSTHRIDLPATLDMAGIGEPTSLTASLDRAVLKHLTRKVSYTGEALYERDIDIDSKSAGHSLLFRFERVLWRSRLFVDGKEVSTSQESLCTPHEYYLHEGLSKGRHHLLLSVDNSKQYDISYEDMAHSYTNETQTMWNGVLGEMSMYVLSPIEIAEVQTYPDLSSKSVKVRTLVVTHKGDCINPRLTLSITRPDGKRLSSKQMKLNIESDSTWIETVYPLGNNIYAWCESAPHLYTLTASVRSAGNRTSSKEVTFGMRELSSENGYLDMNGNRIFLRGTLECCIFPLTGCPPTSEDGWEKVFQSARSWGLNHLRFHSYCPPDAAFRVADKMGFYLQVELPVWSLKIGDLPDVETFMMREYERISRFYGNHPSFCLMTCGNELQRNFALLNTFVEKMRTHDPRHLYAASSFTFERGHGDHPEPHDQFFVTQWTRNGWVRGQGVFDEKPPCFRDNYDVAAKGWGVPLISHEIGQYSVYPNISEIRKYTGTLLPLNLEGIANDLESKGLLSRADDYLQASGRLAGILYKEEIERALKTSDFNGFQLLGLQDFPGQSTALVGLVDAFWDSKGVYSANQFRQFCAPVVPLALFDKATYRSDEWFNADIQVANYSSEKISNSTISWKLSDDSGAVVASGNMSISEIEQGGLTTIGSLTCRLTDINDASRLTLTVSIDGSEYKNSWHIWVYNSSVLPASYDGVVYDNVEAAVSAAKEGKNVLLTMKPESVNGIEGKFLPVFWSPVHFPKQAGTMGLLINPTHPAFRHFPTDLHSDWQWWSIVKRSRVMVIDSISGVTPIIESVDNFVNNRRLASVFEAKLGKGNIIACSIDMLTPDNYGGKYKTGITPELQHLLYSMVSYMQSDDFHPKGEISESQLRSLFSNTIPQENSSPTSVY